MINVISLLNKGKTKRGNKYNIRKNKIANGFSKMSADKSLISNPKHPKYNQNKIRIFLSLAVYGTTDILAKRKGGLKLSKLIKKEHHTDKGYFKEVIVISDYGKKLLNKHTII